MKRMALLTIIITALSMESRAQISSARLPESPVLNAPLSIRFPANPHSLSVKFSGVDPDLRQRSFVQPVACNATTQHMPFFCRQELKVEQRFGVPLRLRIGSVQYTDWLEQKPGAIAP